MEIFVVLLFVILLIVILNAKSSVNKNIDALRRETELLRKELLRRPLPPTPVEPEIKQPSAIAPPAEPVKKDYWESSFKEVAPPEKQIVPEAIEDVIKSPVTIPVATKENIEASPITPIEQKPIHQPPPPAPGFFERHPDLEKFIGENLINKIGIGILVLAIGFFVKYAIDNNWIGPIGRVGVGILCGGILVGLAHRLRTNYKAFSSVLAGGGLAIFYFTIALAYHQFHIFSQPVSFIIMVVITAFAVLLSILYNRQELAIIALVGGFASPFIVSNGSGNYQALFIYLLILNIGLLVIAYNKAWRLLNLLSFIFTVVLFGAWVFNLPEKTDTITYRNGLLFATAFYLLFFIINIAHNIKENKKFIASDFGILLANTSLYFAAGLYFITVMHADNYRGLFSAAMGIFNLGASYLLFRKQKADKNILYLLIGITLTFVSLTAPLQLHGNYITLFWASETVLLYWLYQRSSIGIIKYSSLIIWIAMLLSLFIDWFKIYISNNALTIIFNKAFITGFYSAAACYCLAMLVKKDASQKEKDLFYPGAPLFSTAAFVLLFVSGLLEINFQFNYYYPGTSINVQYMLLYTYAIVLCYALLAPKITMLKHDWVMSSSLIALCMLLYLVFIHQGYSLLHVLLSEKKYTSQFAAHWVADITLVVLFFLLTKLTRKHLSNSRNIDIITWAICAWAVIFLSAESYLICHSLYYTDDNNWFHIESIFEKTVLPILWGLCSFAFMWLGMRHKFRTLRIISLVLFTITLVKLFVFDIRNIPAAGKIAAFFCLGVLLLVVSFMYQRLKRIIIEDEKKKEA
ncbi:MAG: DUF2339 domain-containing protein [Chitinophagaceae bacterium]